MNMCVCVCIYIYIYIYVVCQLLGFHLVLDDLLLAPQALREALLVDVCLGAATSYLSNTASLDVCIVPRVKGHHNLRHHSQMYKNAYIRQAV